MPGELSGLTAEVALIRAQLAALKASKEDEVKGSRVVGVFWDLDHFPLPAQTTPGQFLAQLRPLLKSLGRLVSVRVYSSSSQKVEGLEKGSCTFISVEDGEGGSSRELVGGMLLFALDQPKDGTIVLLSNRPVLASTISALDDRNYPSRLLGSPAALSSLGFRSHQDRFPSLLDSSIDLKLSTSSLASAASTSSLTSVTSWHNVPAPFKPLAGERSPQVDFDQTLYIDHNDLAILSPSPQVVSPPPPVLSYPFSSDVDSLISFDDDPSPFPKPFPPSEGSVELDRSFSPPPISHALASHLGATAPPFLPSPSASTSEPANPPVFPISLFQPLIDLLLSLPSDPHPRQIEVFERLPIHKDVLAAVGASDWMGYVKAAERLNLVVMDAEENWIGLTESYRGTLDPRSTATSSSTSKTLSSATRLPVSSTTSFLNTLPANIQPFSALISILATHPAASPPHQASILNSQEWRLARDSSYRAAGAPSWKGYIEEAARGGIVLLGANNLGAWISLAPAFRPPPPSNHLPKPSMSSLQPPNVVSSSISINLHSSILPFRPLIEVLSSLPWNPPSRQVEVKERVYLYLTKANLDAAQATNWTEYLDEAEDLGVIEMDEEETWIRLTSGYRPRQTPAHFRPLLQMLQSDLYKSKLVHDVRKAMGNANAYSRVGVTGWDAYVKMAAKLKLVAIRGKEKKWIELTSIGRKASMSM